MTPHRYLLAYKLGNVFLRVPRKAQWRKLVGKALTKVAQHYGKRKKDVTELEGVETYHISPTSKTPADTNASDFFRRVDAAYAGDPSHLSAFDLWAWDTKSETYTLVREASKKVT